MDTLSIILIVLISIILILNLGFFIQKISRYPFTWLRNKPKEAFYSLPSKYHMDKKKSHDFQVLHGWNYDLRNIGHKEVYTVQDPHKSLEKVIENYQKDPSSSHYDDLVHLSNYISNQVRYDDKINALIEQIAEITLKQTHTK